MSFVGLRYPGNPYEKIVTERDEEALSDRKSMVLVKALTSDTQAIRALKMM